MSTHNRCYKGKCSMPSIVTLCTPSATYILWLSVWTHCVSLCHTVCNKCLNVVLSKWSTAWKKPVQIGYLVVLHTNSVTIWFVVSHNTVCSTSYFWAYHYNYLRILLKTVYVLCIKQDENKNNGFPFIGAVYFDGWTQCCTYEELGSKRYYINKSKFWEKHDFCINYHSKQCQLGMILWLIILLHDTSIKPLFTKI